MTPIEQALARSFDAEHLAIYADALLARGDRRGELIHLQLAGDDDHRRALEREWLAELPAGVLVTRAEYGFVDVAVDDPKVARALLGSTYRGALRQIWSHGSHELLGTVLETIANGPAMPFLKELRLQCGAADVRHTGTGGAAFVTATPFLHTLSTSGRGRYEQLEHPAVQYLVLRGAGTLAESSWPSVTHLIYQFEPLPISSRTMLALVNRFHQLRLPSLVHLQLEDNVAPAPDVFEFLSRIALAPTTRRVSVPRAPDRMTIDAVRSRHPKLVIEEVELRTP